MTEDSKGNKTLDGLLAAIRKSSPCRPYPSNAPSLLRYRQWAFAVMHMEENAKRPAWKRPFPEWKKQLEKIRGNKFENSGATHLRETPQQSYRRVRQTLREGPRNTLEKPCSAAGCSLSSPFEDSPGARLRTSPRSQHQERPLDPSFPGSSAERPLRDGPREGHQPDRYQKGCRFFPPPRFSNRARFSRASAA